MSKKDYCTWFPEKFTAWNKPSKWWKFWEYWKIIDISPCCKIHDDTCSFHGFIKCLWNNRVVATVIIAIGGTIGCIFLYPYIWFKRI